MLVLTRKVGEEIVIGSNIRIKVMEVRGGKVRIGIVAPENVVVDRQEIHEKRKPWDSLPLTTSSLVAMENKCASDALKSLPLPLGC